MTTKEFVTTPDTNRGVVTERADILDVVNEDELAVCIDWVQLTIKYRTIESICEDLLGIPMELMREDFGTGIRGYSALLRFDDIRILYRENKDGEKDYQILLAGKACRQFEMFLDANNRTWHDFFKLCLDYVDNVPRIDLAIDDRKVYFSIDELLTKARNGECVSRLRLGKEHGGFSLGDGTTRGQTITFGSRESNTWMCFYEKNYERAEKLGLTDEEMEKQWNRYEIRFRQEHAVEVMKRLVNSNSVSDVALGAISNYLRFANKSETNKSKSYWETWKPWAEFVEGVKAIRLYVAPKAKTYDDLLIWVKVYLSPTLKVLKEVDERMGTDNLNQLIDEAKLDKKHLFMIENFENQCKAFSKEEMASFYSNLLGNEDDKEIIQNMERRAKRASERPIELHPSNWSR
ncbi:replication initiation factor domain-containing protein [Oceanobacillus polygoni]|uniref:Phage replication initiation protein n=1 Tax=Oceanobacillus polygoni TaxID=1235259 RepID=A0A9X0YVW7_9BACI|nr:replication initiation factor domain-containing protein [Oceanobacillus polygoni]MBP2079638.1 phage replication initiation protein [Oceanobacillus polygoni]